MALQIARDWSTVPAATLKAFTAALEPQLAREHELLMLDKKFNQQRYFAGLFSGLIVALVSLGGAIYFGSGGDWWGTAILSGPSLIALAKIFVLRRSDPADIQAVLTATRAVLPSARTGSSASSQRAAGEEPGELTGAAADE
ncbi:hypothetical protein ACEZCY_05425 [Streptacidiphilus sp. N1-12]|uniref:Holin-X, holin superfamily III n=2 Tax=Streptacidiphilus alkalitolerans TaxID=3342712 RepID=A0ABV6W9C8_9ACTN